MRNYERFSARVLIFICLVVFVPFNLVLAASNSWTQAGSLAQARAGSAAAPLSDGRILFTGGTDASGALATTETFTPTASFSPGVPMLQARTNHIAVALRDGRVLVAGGTTIDGSFTNTAEIYDPSTNAWTPVSGGMVVARAGHTASLLQDGRVLIAGGQITGGATNTLEIFSPDTNLFAAVTSATLSFPRQQHAAAVLADGRVLIAGGSDGTNALKSADIFDPSSGSISAAGEMSTLRASLSATTLLDGTVLIAGGSNGTADLVSAEIYDPAANAFSVTGNLASARSGHVAFLLPNNNEVLIAGGTSAGTAVASAELFVPWTGNFIRTGALSSPRFAAAGSSLKEDGQLLVAGGADGSNPLATGELFNFATVTTDASDYPPGTTVNISGSGWQPGETVSLTLVESPLYDTHGPYTAVADNSGKIFNNQFATDPNDLNIRFYLTAKGSVSQAQMTFTDSNVATVAVGSQSPNPVAPGSPATYTVNVTFAGNAGSCNADLSVTGLPSGASFTFSANPLIGQKGQTLPSTLTVTPSSGTAANSYTFTVNANPEANCNNNGTATAQGMLVVGMPPSITSANSATFTVGAAALFTVTATGSPAPTLSESGALPSGITFNPSTGALSGTPTAAGAYPITFTASNGGGANAVQNFTLSVSKGTAAITLGSLSQTYNGAAKSATATTAPAGLNVTFTYNGSTTAPTDAGSYTVVATVQDSNYQGTATGTLTINKATPTITWSNSAAITYGAALSATQLNATASVPGALVYSPVAGTVLNTGIQTLSVTFTPTDATNYTTASKTVQLTVNQAVLTVKANDASMTYGGTLPAFSAAYSGFVNGDTATVLTGAPSFTPTTVPAAAGTYPITPAQGSLAAANYTFLFVNGTLAVNKAVLTVKANDASMTYGGTLPAFSANYSGFVNGETVSVLTGAPSFTPTTAPTAAGASAITPSQGTLIAANYTFTFVDGILTVNKAVLTVKANDASMTYGGILPAFSAAYSGFVNNDSPGVVTGSPSFTPTSAPTAAGTSAITPAQGTLIAANYTFTFVDGILTVNKAVLTVKANDASMTYGGMLPAFSAYYSGFVNGETASVLTGTPSFTPTTAPMAAGASAITPSQGTLIAANYTFTFVDGILTVNKAVLTVKADDQSKVYGAALPTFIGTLTGVVNGDGITATYETAATTASPVGAYPITVSLIDPNSKLSNYDVTTTNGSLTISKALLTVTADNATRQYGDANPTFTASYSGFKNGETLATSGVTGTPSLITTATPASAIGGNYAVSAALGGLMAANYDFTFVNGTLTITARPVTVTADAKEKVYGVADPALTYQITNGSLASGDTFSGALVRDAGENAGSYAIKQGTLALSNNYNLTYAGASLTIDKASLTVKANDASRLYGEANPSFTGTITGIQNGDIITATYANYATAASAVGTYPIVPALSDPGNKLGNYNVTATNGALTIGKAPLTVKADDASRLYGAANPVFTGAITGIQNGDSIAASYISSANAASAVGIYPILPTLSDAGNKLGNYSVTIGNGTLTVTPASLTITPAGNKSKILGSTFTAFTGIVSGLQNSDAVTVTYTSPGAPASAAVGAYDITVASVTFTSGSASNYNTVKNMASKGLTVSYNACLLYDPTRAVKAGATYPIKMYLCDANNGDVSSPGVIVNATGIFQNSSFTGAVEDSGNANPDGNFRYDATLGPSGGYIFNLQTSGLRTGGYTLTFTAAGASSSSYSVGFGVK